MNTIWMKLAAAMVAVVVAIIVVAQFRSGESSSAPEAEERTFAQQVAEDRENFPTAPAEEMLEPVEQSQTAVEPEPTTQVEPTVIYVKPISEIEDIEAQRLLSVAAPGRSIGRLPMTGSNLMVETCRQILSRWPDSYYGYQATRLLADLPEHDQERYRITDAEKNVAKFLERRPGTEAFQLKEAR